MALYKRPDSPYWWYAFKMPGQEQICASTKTADRKLAQKIHDIERGKVLEGKVTGKPKKILLSRLVADYLKLNFENTPYLKSNGCTLKAVLEFFKNRFASEITPKELEQYRAARKMQVKKYTESQVSTSTINKEMALLKAAYNAGKKWGEVKENPTDGIQFYSEKDKRRIRYLTQAEKEILIPGLAVHPLLQKIVVFALRTGMRRGEILNLKWTSVDFEKGIISVEKSKGGDKRFLPIHNDIMDILNSLPRSCEYVFSYKEARVKEDSLKNAFARAIGRLEIENFNFHDLRHSFAADYLAMGGTLKGLQELLGHASILMTMRYSHLSKEFVKESVYVMPSLKNYYDFTTLQNKDLIKTTKKVDNQARAVSSVG